MTYNLTNCVWDSVLVMPHPCSGTNWHVEGCSGGIECGSIGLQRRLEEEEDAERR